MVEALYVLTGCSFLGAVLASLAGSAIGARLLFMASLLLAALTVAVYWRLRVA
jgi:hypothetical protein